MNPIVTAKNLAKEYRKGLAPAVADVSLAIEPGEIIAVIGHNGAGKSTLFDLLGGLSQPTRGSVQMNVDRQEIGWCPQREIVDWSLTIRQNIALGVELRSPAEGSPPPAL